MKLSVICFSQRGFLLAKEIGRLWETEAEEVEIRCKCESLRDDPCYLPQSALLWAGEEMEQKNALLFIGAAGIAVRSIAPYLSDKLKDSPVLVMDEAAQFVVPLLSGHVGGANALARRLAEKTGAAAVITTATDVADMFAADEFAKENGMSLTKREGIARVSSRLLEGRSVGLSVSRDYLPEEAQIFLDGKCGEVSPERERALLILSPKEYVIGMGCKKGKTAEELFRFAEEELARLGIGRERLAALASVEDKKDEPGLIELAGRLGVPFAVFSAEQLRRLEGDLERTVGVANVCERAALAACEDGRLILPKQARDGMTLAIARKRWRLEIHDG